MPGGEVRIALVEAGQAKGWSVTGLAEPYCRGIIIVQTNDNSAAATNLADAIRAELMRTEALPGTTIQGAMHPGGSLDDLLGWAGGERSLLVVLAPDGSAWTREAWQEPWLDETVDRALPAMPLALQRQTSRTFPQPLGRINCAFWRRDVVEIVPIILARIGLALETPRIFISYRRPEAQALADQLFEALAERNFDAFLDCFRINPGVDFQRRLKQELGDKSVVLVIESKGILESEWTRYEIDTAKTHQLGLIGLLVPDGVRVPNIDESRRVVLTPSDFTTPFSRDARLEDGALADVVTRVIAEHDRALRRRAMMLRGSVQAALAEAGWSLDGSEGPFLRVTDADGGLRGRVWVCDRPPALTDFHAVRRQLAQAGQELVAVVGLTALMERPRQDELLWLADVSTYALFDTGELAGLTALIGSA
jgi:hypothetical protein